MYLKYNFSVFFFFRPPAYRCPSLLSGSDLQSLMVSPKKHFPVVWLMFLSLDRFIFLISPAAMVELDGDEVRISSRGKFAERDIVQVISALFTVTSLVLI